MNIVLTEDQIITLVKVKIDNILSIGISELNNEVTRLKIESRLKDSLSSVKEISDCQVTCNNINNPPKLVDKKWLMATVSYKYLDSEVRFIIGRVIKPRPGRVFETIIVDY